MEPIKSDSTADNEIFTDETSKIIEKDVKEIKEKMAKIEDSKKWYKNNAFVFSIITFIFTYSVTLYTVYYNRKTKDETDFGTKISSIKNSITTMKEFEREYYPQLGSLQIDQNAKSVINGLYMSKINELVNEVSQKMDTLTINKLTPTTLNDYGNYLSLLGKVDEAIKINKLALNSSKIDKYTTVTIKRTLANLYSQQGENQNLDLSRKCRNEALLLTKSYSGEYAKENIIQSFILWANDEYYNFQNKKFANSLIDSAAVYADKLIDINSKKFEIIRNIRSIKSHFNDKLDINFISGRWNIYKANVVIGSATLVNLGNSYYIDIDLGNHKLEKKIFGNGYFVSSNKMKFTVTSNYLYQIPQYNPYNPYGSMSGGMYGGSMANNSNPPIPQQRIATLELSIFKNKYFNANYEEMGSPLESWRMTFVDN